MELEQEQNQGEVEILAQTGEVEEPGKVAEVEEGESATPDSQEEISDDPAAEPATKKGGGVQERIDELTRLRREAERKAEEAQRKAAYWEGRAEGQKPERDTREATEVAPVATQTARPKEDDFDDYASFVEALADWKTEQKIALLEAKRREETAAEAFIKWKSEGKSKYADFEDVALRQPRDGGPKISTAMADAIKDSSRSHDLAYFLGKNPAVADRIASLPPLAAAREIGKLEAGLESPATNKPRTQSNAPAPIKPITGEGSAAVADISKRSTAEYIAYMNQKEFGRK